VLLAGRVLLALGESLVVTGTMGWGIALVGPQHGGKVMAWLGIAIYAAFGRAHRWVWRSASAWGFAGIAVVSVLLPMLALLAVSPCVRWRPVPAAARLYQVLGAVWQPGLGLASPASVSVSSRHSSPCCLLARSWGTRRWPSPASVWRSSWPACCFAHLPDQIGGAKVALVCVVIEVCGQLLIWQADHAWMAYAGAALTGFGYSLAFPGFGVEAMRRAPPQTRGLAMGAYVAFLDLSLGITSPLAGALASQRGCRMFIWRGRWWWAWRWWWRCGCAAQRLVRLDDELSLKVQAPSKMTAASKRSQSISGGAMPAGIQACADYAHACAGTWPGRPHAARR
jgi:hypothetical protein